MSHFTEGMVLARMAELVSRRRLAEDTAIGLLDEMLTGLDLAGAEFSNEEDMPGHPLGDLIVEALGFGVGFPILRSINPWNIHRGEDHLIVDDAMIDDETAVYLKIRADFMRRYRLESGR